MDESKLGKFVARTGFGQEGRLVTVVSNHFPLQVANQVVYHYDIEIEVLRAGGEQPTPQFIESIGIKRRGSGDSCCKRLRKLSYKINRMVIEELVRSNSMTQEQVFYGVIPVYDGQKNLYAVKPLTTIGTEPGLQKRLFVALSQANEMESKYAVNIQYAGHIDLNAVNLYYKRRATDIPSEAIQALDIILRHGPNLRHIPIGNSFYQSELESERQSLGSGRQLAFGHFQSVRPCMTGSMLVVDRTATAFYSGGNLISFVAQVLGGGKQAEHLLTIPSLRDYDRKRLERELKTLQIEVTHLNYRRRYRITGITQKPAQEVTFPWEREGDNRKMIRIPEYFQEEYSKILKYTNLPCIITGSANRKKYLPMEVCFLLPDQHIRKKLSNDQTATMIRTTASQKPAQRFNVIQDSIQSVINESKPYMREFGIQVKSQPMVVDARVLEAPDLVFRNMNVKPRDGVWNMEKKCLHEVVRLDNWIAVNFSTNVNDNEAKKFITELQNTANAIGMSIEEPVRVARVNNYKPKTLKGIFEKAKAACAALKMILFIIPNDDSLYQEIKLVGDVQIGVPTQCVVDKNVRRCNSSLLSNLLLKINTKLGGVNAIIGPKNTPSILKKRTMIIGADVTHPAPADRLSSSVSAVVGSMDSNHIRYHSSISIQSKSKQEMIRDLDVMMGELLNEYKLQNGQLPEHIIIYRDGVSEGQFEQVLDNEVRRLRFAFDAMKGNYSPKITFIVVQKRHHTRFMPAEESQGVGKFRNIPPGTTVDTDVVHPSDFDFFLCSHFGIQGTSRPTHYYVLWDDNKFSADELQKLTYYLCHTYARCTRSISVPAPVQYAHLAAYRARLHIIGIGGSESSGSDSRDSFESGKQKELHHNKTLNESIRIPRTLKNAMYFC
ncbi:translation initiation factor 2C-like protein [Leptotrombidium deliense]|uniref:Translation initiation factor 2C-like protein n=1 Tax=Leptotrombidium deliense TaxID=299467 RepID=A0A443STU9_9ACAR|nr:translation initiation factor 2C-like protein [Leptotrombidium deliense]